MSIRQEERKKILREKCEREEERGKGKKREREQVEI